jgi:hypothetical protein
MKWVSRLNLFFESQGYTKIKIRIIISVVLVILAVLIFAGYMLFFKVNECKDQNCFNDALSNCVKASFLREDSRTVWFYKILGPLENDDCKLIITLIRMKAGTIDSENLEGKSMACVVKKYDTQYPEKDISQCTGELKEEMQDVIIRRMHDYILKNFQEIKENFSEF